MRLKMQVESVFINVCFTTVVNLGTLELTLLHDPSTTALTCSLHRAKVGKNYIFFKFIVCIFTYVALDLSTV